LTLIVIALSRLNACSEKNKGASGHTAQSAYRLRFGETILLAYLDVFFHRDHNRFAVLYGDFNLAPAKLLAYLQNIGVMLEEFFQGGFNGLHGAIIEQEFCLSQAIFGIYSNKCLQSLARVCYNTCNIGMRGGKWRNPILVSS